MAEFQRALGQAQEENKLNAEFLMYEWVDLGYDVEANKEKDGAKRFTRPENTQD